MNGHKHREIWGWKAAGYLFLAGLGAGSLGVASGLRLLTGDLSRSIVAAGSWVGLLGIGLGGLFLVWDLGVPGRFLKLARYIATPVLLASSMLAVANIAISLFVGDFGRTPAAILAVVTLLSALSTCIYLGFVLAKIKCRPFWNTPALPLLFLLSSGVTGIAGLALLGAATGWLGQSDSARGLLAPILVELLGMECVVLTFYLVTMANSLPEARSSVRRLLRGDAAPVFWGGSVVAGLVVPLVLVAATGLPLWVPAIPALAGGLSLCHSVLSAGARALLPGEPPEAAFVL